MMMIVNISTCNPVKIQTYILPIPKTSNSPPSPPQCCPSNHDKPPDVAPLKSLSSNLSSPCHFERSPKISLRHAAHRKWSTLRKAHCQPEVWPSDVSPLPLKSQISILKSITWQNLQSLRITFHHIKQTAAHHIPQHSRFHRFNFYV